MTVPADQLRTALNEAQAAAAAFITNGTAAIEEAGQGRHLAEQLRAAAEATLQRVRDADTLADALAAVAEHGGLPPEAARATARIAEAAESAEARLAEQARAHAIALAAAEQRATDAEFVALRLSAQTPTAAGRTLAAIRNAKTPADALTHLGMYYSWTPGQAGAHANQWRTTAERIAAVTAAREQALQRDARSDADRYQAAWRNARRRASDQRARADRLHRESQRWYDHAIDVSRRADAVDRDAATARDRARKWKRRAQKARATLDAIRTLGPVGRDHPVFSVHRAMTGPPVDDTTARRIIGRYWDAITGQADK
ncbi:hypothetical protein ACFQ61_02055 [Streptomyces sp. NPDC056500]|uniref:hypothetical protein n=1 Tax=Streptomyces sp. NPDC056500 TaxID=3345840 RepID=UPI003695139E